MDLSALKSLVAQLQLIVNNGSAGNPTAEDFAAVNIPTIQGELKDWWDNSDLKTYLHISTSTIYRRRKDGTFKSFPIGGRHYYYGPDILKLRDKFLK